MLYHNTTHFFWFDTSKEYIASTRRYIHIWTESVPIDMIAMITNDNDNIHIQCTCKCIRIYLKIYETIRRCTSKPMAANTPVAAMKDVAKYSVSPMDWYLSESELCVYTNTNGKCNTIICMNSVL